MKTISFRFKYEDKKLQEVLLEDSRICSAMKRFVFNRLKEKKTKVEINAELKEKFKCNSYLRNSEIIDGSMAFDSAKKRNSNIVSSYFLKMLSLANSITKCYHIFMYFNIVNGFMYLVPIPRKGNHIQ